MEFTHNSHLELRHASNPALEDVSSSLQSTFEELVKSTDDFWLSRHHEGADVAGSTAECSSLAAKTAEDLNNWLVGGRNDPLIEQHRDDVEQLVQAILCTDVKTTNSPSVGSSIVSHTAHLLPPSPPMRGGQLEPFLCELRRYLDEASCALSPIPPSSAMQKHSVPVINRWRNIDLDLPVLVPQGTIMIQYEKPIEEVLCASNASIAVQYTFDQPNDPLRYVVEAQMIKEMFSKDVSGSEPQLIPSNLLCTRLAVLHKCPDFLLPVIAKALFVSVADSPTVLGGSSETLAGYPVAIPRTSIERGGSPGFVLSQPIDLLCSKVSRCSVAQRATTDEYKWFERVEALMEPASQRDERRLSHLSQVLSMFAYVVNEPVTALVANWFAHIVHTCPHLKSIPTELYDPSTHTLGLSFKWAPSRQMKVLLGTRSAVNSSSLSSRRVDARGFQASEIRLEHERRNEKQWDPTLLQMGYKAPCKKLLQTPEGIEARIILCEQVPMPRVEVHPELTETRTS